MYYLVNYVLTSKNASAIDNLKAGNYYLVKYVLTSKMFTI